jgi:Short C-terminal domain
MGALGRAVRTRTGLGVVSDVGILGTLGRSHDADDVRLLGRGIRWLIRQSQAGRVDPALDILRQRYARGEINREEFETKKRDLAP